MPMGQFKDWNECIQKMKLQGHDEESANKICGSIKAKTEGIYNIATSGVGNNIFYFQESQSPPSAPPKAGYKWKKSQSGGWYQVLSQPTTATPKDAKSYIKILQRKLMQAKTPLEQKEIEDEIKYVIKDIKKMQNE